MARRSRIPDNETATAIVERHLAELREHARRQPPSRSAGVVAWAQQLLQILARQRCEYLQPSEQWRQTCVDLERLARGIFAGGRASQSDEKLADLERALRGVGGASEDGSDSEEELQ